MEIWLLARKVGLRATAQSALIQRAAGRGIDLRVVFPERCVSRLSSSGLEILCDGAVAPLPDGAINYLAAAGSHLSFTFARQLEVLGVPFINPVEAIWLGRDKAATLQILAAAGLPVPKTTLLPLSMDPRLTMDSLTMDSLAEFPVVVKTAMGSQGRGVYLCENRADFLDTVARIKGAEGDDQTILVQEYIRTSPARDLRVYVVGGQVLGAVAREGAPGEWKTNLAVGGRGWEQAPDDEMTRLSVEACRLLGLSLAGVDLLIGPQGYLLSEVNPAPLFRVSEEGSFRSFDVPDRIFDWFERL